jgi:hypothetical protein
MISLRLSVSTSFMLAALRVLHIDTSHAPATGPSIEEWPFTAHQVSGATTGECPASPMRQVWLGFLKCWPPFLVILTGHGGGLAERIALYPLILWLIVFGIAILTKKLSAGNSSE